MNNRVWRERLKDQESLNVAAAQLYDKQEGAYRSTAQKRQDTVNQLIALYREAPGNNPDEKFRAAVLQFATEQKEDVSEEIIREAVDRVAKVENKVQLKRQRIPEKQQEKFSSALRYATTLLGGKDVAQNVSKRTKRQLKATAGRPKQKPQPRTKRALQAAGINLKTIKERTRAAGAIAPLRQDEQDAALARGRQARQAAPRPQRARRPAPPQNRQNQGMRRGREEGNDNADAEREAQAAEDAAAAAEAENEAEEGLLEEDATEGDAAQQASGDFQSTNKAPQFKSSTKSDSAKHKTTKKAKAEPKHPEQKASGMFGKVLGSVAKAVKPAAKQVGRQLCDEYLN